eukprot:m.50164 g.50164  ORF g.50164 m.50164 type:complete len:105 (-) comp8995_c0_seq4:966-1280(-)
MSDGKRAEMLKKAKDAMVGKKPEGNEHKIIGKKDEEITVTQADLPETPVLFLQGCEGCGFTFAPNVTVVKVLIEGLKRCKVEFECTFSSAWFSTLSERRMFLSG